MFYIDADKTIHLTRGDIAVLSLSTFELEDSGEYYIFQIDDVVRFCVFEKGQCGNVVLTKDVVVQNETTTVDMYLTSEDTRIGEVINKPKDYWYECELNPDTRPQTFIGYNKDGPKIFRLYPEGDVGR